MSLRPYQKVIVDLVKPESKVIDIGCGGGYLLANLAKEKKVQGHGIEYSAERVRKGVNKGVSVIQGDADNDLQYYPDEGFDYAIMSMTVQVMKHPKEALEQALRISKKVVVVIPNFGHIRNRLYFSLKGRMPVTEELSYEWYDTPNIHFCTIKDMVALAEELSCVIEKRMFLTKGGVPIKFSGKGSFFANLFGEYGIFLLAKKED